MENKQEQQLKKILGIIQYIPLWEGKEEESAIYLKTVSEIVETELKRFLERTTLTPQVEKPNKEEPSQIGGAEFHVFNSPSDKTLEAVVEDWNKQASELSETYEVEKPSVTSDKTWEERFDKLDIEYNWEIESPPRGRIKSFIQKELTSATIKAREQGYVERVKEEIEEEMVKIRELQEKIKKDFKLEEPRYIHKEGYSYSDGRPDEEVYDIKPL